MTARPAEPTPVIRYGDAAEDASDYARLVGDLRAHYGVEGPVEEVLLERLASLTWRLRRLALIEAALATQGTIGLRWRASLERLREARAELAVGSLDDGLMRSVNPELLAQGLGMLEGLIAQIEARQVPTVETVRTTRDRVLGTGPGGQSAAGTERALVLALGLRLGAGAGAEPDELDEAAYQALLHHLTELLAMGRALHAELVADAEHADTAHAEARLLPEDDTLRGLGALEARLERAWNTTRQELEVTVGRRRLAASVRASGLLKRLQTRW